jgi:hypothetical protein
LREVCSAAALRILHVGEDDADRVSLMQKSGLTVERAKGSLCTIKDFFAKDKHFSAITFQEANDFPSSFVLDTLRSRSAAPFVLFGNPTADLERSAFPGLIIPDQTPPFVWLKYLLALISEGVSLRARSRRLREESAAIRRELGAVRARSAGLVYNDTGGKKTFIVTMNARPVGSYSVIADCVEIHGEHLALVHSGGKLASLFLMGAVESLVQLEDPLDPTEG